MTGANEKTFDDSEAFVASHQKALGINPAEKPSELSNLKEKEAMLIEKGNRIEKMDGNAMAREGRDINELKQRNQTQLAEVRKEIARLSK